MGAEFESGRNIDANIGLSQKILGSIFDKLGLKYSITKKGNFVGKGADGKSNDFIRYLQKKIGLKYSKGEKKGKLMPYDGSISENSAKIILAKFLEKDIKKIYKDFLKINIREKSIKNLKIHSLKTLKYFLNTSMLNNKIIELGINTKIKGTILIGTDYDSKQFINYLQVKYNLGTVDGMISNKYAEKLSKGIGKKSFKEINEDRLKKEKKDLEKLSVEIENLDKHGTIQEFVGFYLDKNGNKKYKKIQEGYIPELGKIKLTKYKLREGETLKNFNEMMKNFGGKFNINDTYRSVANQKKIYNKQILENKNNGKVITATIPGTSEHHLGLAIDINNPDRSIRKWLKINAYKYGFARTYKSVKRDGFNEAWHYRYVGVKMATYLKNHNMGMGEFYTRNSKKLNTD